MPASWRIAEGVAWVGDEDRVALIDTRSADARPMIVPPDFAELWRHVADGDDDLLAKGAELAGEHAHELVAGFVETMLALDVLEAVEGER